MNRKPALATALGLALALSLLAAAPAETGTVHNRQDRQQARIGQGICDGQLTARDTTRLETREASLNREVGAVRADNGGNLTPAERALVEHQQNRLSRSISRQKHDGQSQ